MLRLEPGEGSAPLRGSLIESESGHGSDDKTEGLHFSDEYEALSYVWGDFSERTTMTLNNCRFYIGKSLANALLHIRSQNEILTLWIDALCINQQDAAEKPDQVRQMLGVYSTAARVHIWLGTSTEHSELGMRTLKYFSESRRQRSQPLWETLPAHLIGVGMEDILSREWFSRVWVVQEAAVAKNVVMHCGSSELAWSNTMEQVRSFSRSIKAAAISPEWAQSDLKTIDTDKLLNLFKLSLENGHQKSEYGRLHSLPDLLDIAYEMRHRKASDPRDKLFAMLGLASENTRLQLYPDYTMPLKETHRLFEDLMLNKSPLEAAESNQVRAEVTPHRRQHRVLCVGRLGPTLDGQEAWEHMDLLVEANKVGGASNNSLAEDGFEPRFKRLRGLSNHIRSSSLRRLAKLSLEKDHINSNTENNSRV